LVNFGQVTPEFNWKAYTPHRSAVWLRSLGSVTARPCMDQYWVFWDHHYSVLFHLYAIDGVTAMPRGLHAIGSATHF